MPISSREGQINGIMKLDMYKNKSIIPKKILITNKSFAARKNILPNYLVYSYNQYSYSESRLYIYMKGSGSQWQY